MKIRGLYLKRGWFYYQPPSSEGIRPKAIALQTKDEGTAIDEVYRLQTQSHFGEVSKKRMESVLSLYLKVKLADQSHTPKTSDITRRCLSQVCEQWKNPPVNKITRAMVEDWRAELMARNLSDSTSISYMRRIAAFTAWLVEEKLIRHDPVQGIRIPKVKRTRRQEFCTVAERDLILAGNPPRDIELMIHLGFFAGLRIGEMLALEASWLTFTNKGGLLSVQATKHWKPKDKELRNIEMHPRLAACLRGHIGNRRTGWVIAPENDQWKRPPNYRYWPHKAFKNYLRGVDPTLEWVNFHTMRHSFASHLAINGAKMTEIAYALGDSLRVTEETYIGLSPVSRSMIHSL